MSIKVYRIKIEGFVAVSDTKDSQSLTPANWPMESILKAMVGEPTITETLVDTIEDKEGE